MNEPPSHVATPCGDRLVDSPWFWACLFATAGVAALAAIGPKYRQREARLESSFRMREHLARANAGQERLHDDVPVAAGDDSLIKSTGPLIWILGVAVVAAWTALLWSRRRTGRPRPASLFDSRHNAAPPEV
jgi:hypothetical protein